MPALNVTTHAKRSGREGHSVIETMFIVPVLAFTFIGIFDFGFIAHALIGVENAARSAALYASSNPFTAADTTTACSLALNELRKEPNVGSGVANCASAPVQLSATSITGADGLGAVRVTVTYQTATLIAIPGILPPRTTLRRTVQMRVRSNE